MEKAVIFGTFLSRPLCYHFQTCNNLKCCRREAKCYKKKIYCNTQKSYIIQLTLAKWADYIVYASSGCTGPRSGWLVYWLPGQVGRTLTPGRMPANQTVAWQCGLGPIQLSATCLTPPIISGLSTRLMLLHCNPNTAAIKYHTSLPRA